VFESLTKRSLDEETLRALIRTACGPDSAIAEARELNEGFFNAAFRVALADGREVVLKASPTPDVPLLTYERDIMRAEAEFFRCAAASGAPLPLVVHAGFDRTLIDGDFIVMSAVDGVTWHSVEQGLGDAAKAALRRELGGIIARLHRVTHPAGRFGYPAVAELSASSWPDAFLAMFGAMLGDAERYAATLPVPVAQLRTLVERHADALAEVRTPSLLHFDLWPGNVMITGYGNGEPVPRISGLIDGERMIWGDPLMEFIGMDVFGRADLDEDVAGGYLDAGGAIDRGEDGNRRLALYHLYMQVLRLARALSALINPVP
jgi:aminoglycoside phosphotransferase (APT) family kinase protein